MLCLFYLSCQSIISTLHKTILHFQVFFDMQVGDSDQKLAEGISLYSIATTTPNKHNLLPTLISVSKAILWRGTSKYRKQCSYNSQKLAKGWRKYKIKNYVKNYMYKPFVKRK